MNTSDIPVAVFLGESSATINKYFNGVNRSKEIQKILKIVLEVMYDEGMRTSYFYLTSDFPKMAIKDCLTMKESGLMQDLSMRVYYPYDRYAANLNLIERCEKSQVHCTPIPPEEATALFLEKTNRIVTFYTGSSGFTKNFLKEAVKENIWIMNILETMPSLLPQNEIYNDHMTRTVGFLGTVNGDYNSLFQHHTQSFLTLSDKIYELICKLYYNGFHNFICGMNTDLDLIVCLHLMLFSQEHDIHITFVVAFPAVQTDFPENDFRLKFIENRDKADLVVFNDKSSEDMPAINCAMNFILEKSMFVFTHIGRKAHKDSYYMHNYNELKKDRQNRIIPLNTDYQQIKRMLELISIDPIIFLYGNHGKNN